MSWLPVCTAQQGAPGAKAPQGPHSETKFILLNNSRQIDPSRDDCIIRPKEAESGRRVKRSVQLGQLRPNQASAACSLQQAAECLERRGRAEGSRGSRGRISAGVSRIRGSSQETGGTEFRLAQLTQARGTKPAASAASIVEIPAKSTITCFLLSSLCPMAFESWNIDSLCFVLKADLSPSPKDGWKSSSAVSER